MYIYLCVMLDICIREVLLPFLWCSEVFLSCSGPHCGRNTLPKKGLRYWCHCWLCCALCTLAHQTVRHPPSLLRLHPQWRLLLTLDVLFCFLFGTCFVTLFLWSACHTELSLSCSLGSGSNSQSASFLPVSVARGGRSVHVGTVVIVQFFTC